MRPIGGGELLSKWSPERRITQGNYYYRIGNKHAAARQWGKAGAQIKETMKAKRMAGVWGFDFDIREDYNE
jgi:hypothetical protein